MSDILATILNILTMCCLIFFAATINAELHEKKMQLTKRIFRSIFTFSLKPLKEINSHWVYILCYVLVPVLLCQFLVIIRQYNIGRMYIRPDISFATSFATWIIVPAIILGFINLEKNKDKK